jgi:hypothetical protein
MPVPDYGNVPSQVQYGEQQQIDAQRAGASMGQADLPSLDKGEPPAPVAPDLSQSVYRPSPNNIVSVLPPANTAPSETGIKPLRPEEELAYMILGTPGMGSMAKSMAAQIVGKYPVEASIPEEQLPPDALEQLRTRQAEQEIQAQMGV